MGAQSAGLLRIVGLVAVAELGEQSGGVGAAGFDGGYGVVPGGCIAKVAGGESVGAGERGERILVLFEQKLGDTEIKQRNPGARILERDEVETLCGEGVVVLFVCVEGGDEKAGRRFGGGRGSAEGKLWREFERRRELSDLNLRRRRSGCD